MKAYPLFALLMAAIAMSCSRSSVTDTTPDVTDQFQEEESDSLAFTLAATEGMTNSIHLQQAMMEDSSLSKKEFLEGFRYGFAADTSASFRYGMYTAIRLAKQLGLWEQQGVSFNHKAFEKTFSKFFMADTISQEELSQYREVLNALNQRLNEAARKCEIARMENSEVSQLNIKEGREYIDSVAKRDPAIKLLPSGVAVKIENAGTGPKITPSDRIVLYYTAETPSGYVFDQANENNARPISVASRVNGLQQALAMLGKGGSATVYIPGPEAFGVESNRRYRLEPNQMVIYHINIKDILPE